MPVLAGGARHRASLRVPKPSLAPVPGWWGVPDQGFRGAAAESASARAPGLQDQESRELERLQECLQATVERPS